MATIRAFIRVSGQNRTKAHIRFRLRDGRRIQLSYSSRLTVNPAHWNPRKEEIRAKIPIDPLARAEFNRSVTDMKNLIMDIYNSEPDKTAVSSVWLKKRIENEPIPEQSASGNSFFMDFRRFLSERKFSDVRERNFMVLYRILLRFEIYMAIEKVHGFELTFSSFTSDVMVAFEDFLKSEHTFFRHDGSRNPTVSDEGLKAVYEIRPVTRIPRERGRNTLNGLFTKLRTFFRWAIAQGLTDNNPFNKFSFAEAVYGTPYYITNDERNRLCNTDFSSTPSLAIQRDIFIFQCLIGCRISDLYSLTRSNIINGAIEYIPRKTKDGRPVTVRVPLNDTARMLVAKYENGEKAPIFPFISKQKYNTAIKKMFTAAGLTRKVVTLNPTTGEEEIRPLNEIASSHIARRTFVGNLYKMVKDPSLIGALSGHKEGSRAFARYRDIDEEMKRQLVDLLR